jgi:GAF domain-containing protein
MPSAKRQHTVRDNKGELIMASEHIVNAQHDAIHAQLLHVLSEMGKRFTFRSSEDDVINYIGEEIKKLLAEHFSHCYVILQHRWSGQLSVVLRYEHGQKQSDPSNHQALLRQIGLSAIHQIIHARTPLLFPDKKTIAEHRGDSENFAACWLGVPMNIANRAIGAVVVCHPVAEYVYTDAICKALDAMTDLAASEIDHARLMKRFELLAHVEKELTGLRSREEREVLEFIHAKVREFKDIDTRNLAIVPATQY